MKAVTHKVNGEAFLRTVSTSAASVSVSGRDHWEERRTGAGRSVEGELHTGTVALDVLIMRVKEALMQQSHDFILHGKV